MAKQAKAKKVKSVEETLWESAVKLRGTVEPSEYKHVVFGLIFLKFASDKFEERRNELVAEGKEKYLEVTDFYTMKNVNSLVYFLSLLQGQSLFQEAFYGSSLPTHLSGGALKFILIATPLISTIAGVIPALKASKVAPAVTLKSE